MRKPASIALVALSALLGASALLCGCGGKSDESKQTTAQSQTEAQLRREKRGD